MMRTQVIAWSVLLALRLAPAPAGEPACCRLFGFDASAMLGDDPAICGGIVDARDRQQAERESLADRQSATRCALEAQAQGRAFVYTYRLLAGPDIDMVSQAVFGAHGERLFLRMGLYGGENIRTVQVCSSMTVLPDGKVKPAGCRLRQGTL